MNLCDVNVWLALSLSGHAHHGAARQWLEGIDDRASIAFCRATQQGLLRLLTNSAVLAAYGRAPLTNDEAWAVYVALRGDDRIVFVPDPSDLDDAWARLACRPAAAPKLWMDAYLAACALTQDLVVVTTDRAFTQFQGVRVRVLG